MGSHEYCSLLFWYTLGILEYIGNTLGKAQNTASDSKTTITLCCTLWKALDLRNRGSGIPKLKKLGRKAEEITNCIYICSNHCERFCRLTSFQTVIVISHVYPQSKRENLNFNNGNSGKLVSYVTLDASCILLEWSVIQCAWMVAHTYNVCLFLGNTKDCRH